MSMSALNRSRAPRWLESRGESCNRREQGQSLVEFALVLPLLLVLVFGIVEFAGAWRTYQIITNVAREGARLAVIPSSTQSEVQTLVAQGLTDSGLDPALATISLNLCSGSGCEGTPDEVSIDYPHDFVLMGPLAQLACSSCGGSYGTITLSTTTVMRNE